MEKSNELVGRGAVAATTAYIGAMPVPLSRFFIGAIDEVRIWNRSLTQAEIAARYLGCEYTSPEPTVSLGSEVSLANVPSNLFLASDSLTQITASWNANSNPDGTEYFAENTTAGTNSGWNTSLSYVSSGLNRGTTYSFRVKARNGDGIETAFTDSLAKTTQCCGGSGLPPVAFMPPASPQVSPENPEGGFKVLINDKTEKTDNQIVTLKLFAGSDTKRMAISNNPEFSGLGSTGQIPYQSSYQWNLCRGQEDICEKLRVGELTGYEFKVYAKFFTD